jgi:hypothetical protein
VLASIRHDPLGDLRCDLCMKRLELKLVFASAKAKTFEDSRATEGP